MGACCVNSQDDPAPKNQSLKNVSQLDPARQNAISLDHFIIEKVIGRGAFGKVLLVTKKDTGQLYAMKTLKKSMLAKRNQITNTKTERQIMGGVDHPFIVQLRFAFQTSDKLYMCMDFINGGELFYHLRKAERFTEEKTRFYTGEIIVALNYLHSLGIIYRDLKPENILLDCDGHIKLTDFGLSKQFFPTEDKAFSFCGTPEYLAPEILRGTGHDQAADYWSLGILVYEMLNGSPPFFHKNREQLYKDILNKQAVMKSHFSSQATGLLTELLERDPAKRLSRFEDIIGHPFFEGISWDLLSQKQVIPPFKPKVSGPRDLRNIDTVFTDEKPVNSLETDSSRNSRNKYQGFTYDPIG